MAPQHSPQRQVQALWGAVFFDRLDGVFGACGQKTAGRRKKRRHNSLVELYDKGKQSTHQKLRSCGAAQGVALPIREVGALAPGVLRLRQDPCLSLVRVDSFGSFLLRFFGFCCARRRSQAACLLRSPPYPDGPEPDMCTRLGICWTSFSRFCTGARIRVVWLAACPSGIQVLSFVGRGY